MQIRSTRRSPGPRRPYSSVLLSRMSHVTTSTPCASASFRSCETSASAMHFESNASNAASSARSLSPPIAARCLSWSPTDMSTRAGEPSVGMIPRITGGLDSTGCSDHRTSLAENSGATCWPGTIGPPQREHTIGGKLLGGFVCLRELLGWRSFSASGPTYGGPRLMQGKAPTDLKKMMTETNHAEVVGGGEKPRNSDVCKLETMASRAASSAWSSRHAWAAHNPGYSEDGRAQHRRGQPEHSSDRQAQAPGHPRAILWPRLAAWDS